MADRVRIGLIGTGRIGRRHAATLAFETPRAELVAVADVDAEAARETAAAVRVARWTTDASELIADSTIDAIVIASSTDSHAPLIAAAAEAGKDIFCEKPIALDLPATDHALAAVEAAGVKLQMGFQRRFDKAYRRAKELIAAGDLGRIEMIRDTMRDPRPAPRSYIETSGGHYRDMAIHCFDAVRWLMDAEVDELFTMAAALVDPMFADLGDVDTSVVSLRFASGGLGFIDTSRRSGFGYDMRTEIFGSESSLFIGYQRQTAILQLSPDGVRSDHVHWFLDRFGDAYREEIRAFVDCLVDDTPPLVDGDDARAAMALAYAAEASRQERRPVSPGRFERQ